MKEKIISIQILRALACLLVLQCHFLFVTFSFHASNFFYCGAIGVDLFFVISGYIIAGSLENLPRQKSGLYFFINRFSRVAPYYYLITILTFVLLIARYHHISLQQTEQLFESFVFFPQKEDPTQLLGWSLNHEIFFYLFVAIALWLSPKVKTVVIGLGFCLLVFAASFVHVRNSPILQYAVGFMNANMNYLFVAGFLLHKYRNKVLPFFRLPLVSLACVVLFAAIPLFSFVIDATEPYKRSLVLVRYFNTEVPRFLIWGIPSILLFLAFLAKEEWLRKFSNTIWVRIGDASYSVYLVQGLFLQRSPKPFTPESFG